MEGERARWVSFWAASPSSQQPAQGARGEESCWLQKNECGSYYNEGTPHQETNIHKESLLSPHVPTLKNAFHHQHVNFHFPPPVCELINKKGLETQGKKKKKNNYTDVL